jgi:hypothetical protein
VEICGIAYLRQMKAACVPLPAPGAPNKISLMDVLESLEIGGRCGLDGGTPAVALHSLKG